MTSYRLERAVSAMRTLGLPGIEDMEAVGS